MPGDTSGNRISPIVRSTRTIYTYKPFDVQNIFLITIESMISRLDMKDDVDGMRIKHDGGSGIAREGSRACFLCD